jgi:adenine-specific DNA-methyltransferase
MPDFRTELAAQLAGLMPEVLADGKVDVQKLKELLGEDAGDESERFGLFWPGKKRALRAAQTPTTATLRPDVANSKDWDTTQNVFIEGDNLETLKILQKRYHNQIKLIYIDPPYNTGKDFVYPDNYREGLETYLEWTRQVNEEGKKVSSNSETEGRYHSNWLNMMYPRLKLARNLLTEDGVIFISIDDNEQDNLKKICNEVFGEACFIGTIVWHNSSRQNDLVAIEHEYIHIYGRKSAVNGSQWNRSREVALRLERMVKAMQQEGKSIGDAESVLAFEIDCLQEEDTHKGTKNFSWLTNYKNIDSEWNIYYPVDLSGEGSGPPRKFGDKIVPAPAGRHWMGQDYIDELMLEGRIVWRGERAYRKLYIQESLDNLKSIVSIPTRNGSEQLKKLLGKDIFDKPKPVNLIAKLMRYVLGKDDVILDFFAGSATTAHAVIQLNAEDNGNRRFIMVQLPEPTPEDSEARKAGFKTIADISRKRIEWAGEKIRADAGLLAQNLDTGFRAYKLADTNFTKWRVRSDIEADKLQQHLLDLRDSADDNATADDLLTEILLKIGFSLTAKITPLEIAGLAVRQVGDNLMLAYLDEQVKPTLEQLRALAAIEPVRLIVLEDAFHGDDELKTNLAQLCKSQGIELWTA